MSRVLLTGFEPFGGETSNSSWEAVTCAAAETPPGIDITVTRLSCAFGTALDELRAAIARAEPDLVLCTGQAGGRPDLTVERVAVNVDDARIPDNAGRQPIDEAVVDGGPVAYLAALPIKACVAAARAAGVPASVSQTAGTFVCNHVFYGLMHLIATELPGLRGGFVHVPYTPEQTLGTARPSLPSSLAARGLRAVLSTAASRDDDIRLPGGATH
jgi:pyroglutamyl-peptidase